MKYINDLQGIFAGQDVYLLGSGASLNYIDKSFFDGKNTVATNHVTQVYLPTATVAVTKYHELALKIAKEYPNTKVVVSKGNRGSIGFGEINEHHDNLYLFAHNQNLDGSTDIRTQFPKENNSLLVSWSTITSAMHFCAYSGAKNIIMVGVDSGSIDGNSWVDGYPSSNKKDLNQDFEYQTRITKEVIRDLYGCNIHSLNPFINYNLEGHEYRGANSIN